MHPVQKALSAAGAWSARHSPDDFFQIHHVLPRDRYRHTPAFLGQEYSEDMILLETHIHHGTTEGDAVDTAEVSQ